MSNLNLVTGHRGVGHVTAEDHGSFQAAIFGTGSYVLDRGNKFAASVITNNQIRIADGDLLQQGRHTRLKEGTYIDLAIENGEQARNRSDLIVCRYTKDSVTGVEESNMIVIKGEPAAGTPVDPAHVEGDIINDHVYIADMLMFRVSLEGLNITGITPLFTVKSINDQSIISDAWNDTDTYNVGDYSIDENVLYKCLIPNSGMKPSTSPDYWVVTSVSSELSKKQSPINYSNIISLDGKTERVEVDRNGYLIGNYINRAASQYSIIVSVNSVRICVLQGETYNQIPIFIPLKKNDVVTISYENKEQCNFYILSLIYCN